MAYETDDTSQEMDLIAADLSHILAGQVLFLRDPRRTPVQVLACVPATASFTVRVAAFEDKGAEWVLPFWDIAKFEVARGAACLGPDERNRLAARSAVFERHITIDVAPRACQETLQRIVALQADTEAWLRATFPELPTDAAMLTDGTTPSPQWSRACEAFMQRQSVARMDQAFARHYASNPNAGELIKGHRLAMADLGLVPYDGPVPRDPQLFEGDWSKPARGAHVVARLAFMRAMLALLGLGAVPLYRTVYSTGGLTGPINRGFVSATFSPDVAADLFAAGQATNVAATYWQKVAPERIFMTYWETPALSVRYQEVEAVLLFDPLDGTF